MGIKYAICKILFFCISSFNSVFLYSKGIIHLTEDIMKKITTILFDFDGVIANTEPLYDKYINEVNVRYMLGIDNFADKVKGTPTPDIIKKYFSHLDSEGVATFERELLEFETAMDIPPIAGALEFIDYVQTKGYKIGLVTSSQQIKMDRALKLLSLTGKFDTEVTADRITEGKPNPMCFLLAAKDLHEHPENCIVFEDSLHGINAGHAAGMKVIGVTTSFSEEQMGDKIHSSIQDFSDLEKVISLL